MATPLTVSYEFDAAPAAVYALFTDADFLQARMEAGGGINPTVVSATVEGDGATVVTQQAIPASVLPSMVASMIPGDPVTERTETWSADGDGYTASYSVVVKGAPASLKGAITLAPSGSGSTLAFDGAATVPIPMFGGKLESVIVEQITEALNKEAEYTRSRLG